MARILAVDWGERRIGLAVSDPTELIATGLPTLVAKSVDDAVQQVCAVAREQEVEAIVVGLPLLMSGERGTAAEAASEFAAELAAGTGLPVDTYDERLTSALSQRRITERGQRVGRNKGMLDQGAAQALLESYMQRRASQRRAESGR